LNWQLVNGLAYFGKVTHPDLAYAWLTHVLPYAPALVRDNLAIHRDVAMTERARTLFVRAYGPLFEVKADPRVSVPTLTEIVRPLPRDTPYVLCVLRPSRDLVLDRDDLAAAVRVLTGRETRVPPGDYAAIAGVTGREAALIIGSAAPFRRTVTVGGIAVEIRMESWLAFDTIRRMGFGHVVAARRHTLIVERGVSFATFDTTGRATRTAYLGNIFAPQPRFIIAASSPP
jgi:hypothetical protein